MSSSKVFISLISVLIVIMLAWTMLSVVGASRSDTTYTTKVCEVEDKHIDNSVSIDPVINGDVVINNMSSTDHYYVTLKGVKYECNTKLYKKVRVGETYEFLFQGDKLIGMIENKS